MARRIDAYAACFADIDRHFAAATAIRQDTLLSLFGAEGLRRQHLVVRFLVGRLSLHWDPGRAKTFVEAGRIESVLASSDNLPWGPTLRAYRCHLEHAGTLRTKTVRLYLKAAANLLEHSGYADLPFIRQAEVDRYLRRQPGQKASLMRFLAYGAQTAGKLLAIPRGRPASTPRSRENTVLRAVRDLLDRLDQADNAAQGRALLAAAISKLYLVPLSTVLALTASDVSNSGSAVILWPNGLALRLAPPLTNAFRRWASWQGSYLFPGKNTVQPLSRDAVRHHALGIGLNPK